MKKLSANKSGCTIGWLIVLCLLSSFTSAQQMATAQDDKARGIQLYNQGDAAGATVALKAATKRNKNDLEAWYYLASAFESQIKLKDARKAHEKAAKLGESLLSAQFTLPNPEFDIALRNIRPLLERAAVSAERYLALSEKPAQKKVDEWRGRRELLRDFFSLAQETMDNIYPAKDVTTKAVILFKPEPPYTEEARKNGITGRVELRVLLAADGKVRAVAVIKGLRYGLTGTAISAARRIRFTPARKDGNPVSIWIMLQYDYSIY